MLMLLPYSIDINWSVMFTGGHPILTFLCYGCDVCASKYVMCARIQTLWFKLSEVILACVVHLCCVLKLFKYSSVHCSVCQNLGTAFTCNERNQKSLSYRCCTQSM